MADNAIRDAARVLSADQPAKTLARLFGVLRPTAKSWYTGKRRPSIGVLEVLRDVLGHEGSSAQVQEESGRETGDLSCQSRSRSLLCIGVGTRSEEGWSVLLKGGLHPHGDFVVLFRRSGVVAHGSLRRSGSRRLDRINLNGLALNFLGSGPAFAEEA